MTEEALAEAYRRFGTCVYRRCRLILRNEIAAEDVVQVVFTKLWRYGHGFEQAESKLAWLYRVAERCCFDWMDRAGSRATEPLEQIDRSALTLHAKHPVEVRELALRLLERLEDRGKQVALLHFIDGLTQEEIAQALGCSRQTIGKELKRLGEHAAQLGSEILREEA
jgi:RNA polymerase sigma-70 factor (ECF subfamily)